MGFMPYLRPKVSFKASQPRKSQPPPARNSFLVLRYVLWAQFPIAKSYSASLSMGRREDTPEWDEQLLPLLQLAVIVREGGIIRLLLHKDIYRQSPLQYADIRG